MKPIRNASCSLRGTQCNRLLILIGRIGHFDLVMLVWTEIEGCHMEQRWSATWSHGEAPTNIGCDFNILFDLITNLLNMM